MHPEAEADYREFVAARIDTLGRFAFLLCHDWHRAEDAVQKALTKLYLHWSRAKNPDGYVRRVLVNAIRDDARLFSFWRERPSRRLPERALADPAEAGAVRMTMVDALSRVPPRQRTAVVLRFWEDLSVEQTAQIMGCSTGTVKSQTARGLETLRGLLGESLPTQAEGALR